MDAQWTIVIGITLQRNGLETQWEQSEKVSTEDLRLSLRRYHFFLNACCRSNRAGQSLLGSCSYRAVVFIRLSAAWACRLRRV